MEFNKKFKIIQEPELPQLKEEIRRLAARKRYLYVNESKNILHTWDRIERDQTDNFKFVLLPKLAKAAQSLPTSSSDIEQSFSQMKLVKTLLRNSLKNESLEAILLIVQEFNKKKIVISDEFVTLSKLVKDKINERKMTNKRKASLFDKSKLEESKVNQDEGMKEPRIDDEEIEIEERILWDEQDAPLFHIKEHREETTICFMKPQL